MQKKLGGELIPLATRKWFVSPQHLFGGVFNLLWCLLNHTPALGYIYLCFVFLSIVVKIQYMQALLLAYVIGLPWFILVH